MAVDRERGEELEDGGGFETIARYSTPAEAHVMRARLEAEGIPAIVADEYTVSANWLWSVAVGGVRLQVPAELAGQAMELLAAVQAGNYALADEVETPSAGAASELQEALLAYARDPYYPRVWARLITHDGGLAGFNVFATLFGAPWFMYRKMYRAGLGVLGVELLVLAAWAFAPGLLGAWPMPDEGRRTLYTVASLALLVRLPAGLAANVLYYRQALAEIARVTAAGQPAERRLAALKARGGINVGAGMLVLAGMVALRALLERW